MLTAKQNNNICCKSFANKVRMELLVDKTSMIANEKSFFTSFVVLLPNSIRLLMLRRYKLKKSHFFALVYKANKICSSNSIGYVTSLHSSCN